MPRPASDTGAGAQSLATGMARTSSASSARPEPRAGRTHSCPQPSSTLPLLERKLQHHREGALYPRALRGSLGAPPFDAQQQLLYRGLPQHIPLLRAHQAVAILRHDRASLKPKIAEATPWYWGSLRSVVRRKRVESMPRASRPRHAPCSDALRSPSR